MAIANFIPEIWSSAIFVRLRKRLVFGDLTNQDYTGDIAEVGDTVRINEIGPITVNDYTRGSDITYEALTDAEKVLLIDQQKYWAFSVDDLDKRQANKVLVGAAADEASYAMRDTMDQFIAAFHADAGVTSGLGTTSTAIGVSSGNIIEYIGIVKQKLAENDCPAVGLWGVVPPWFIQKMEMAEITKDTKNSAVMGEGYYARVLGVDIYESNNVVNTTSTTFARTMWGNNRAITMAYQLVQTEAIRLENQFADGLRGLALYGGKVVRPTCLARLIASQNSG